LRPPVDTIAAPLFPSGLPWVNLPRDRVAQAGVVLQGGGPMLVEFWDFCRPNSLRTLPYIEAWHERYAGHGLRTIGVHCPGFAPSGNEQAVRDAVERLGISYPVLIDSQLELWREYENVGWPARYLFNEGACLFEYHYGEGGYAETERAIQELLGVERPLVPTARPEDVPEAQLAAQTADQPGAYSGPYEAGGVWAVLDGAGAVTVAGTSVDRDRGGAEIRWSPRQLTVTHPGAYPLIEHGCHTAGTLELEIGPGVRCHATCFTPGIA
jgi:thiol-disulfide isomerase/thioredoxin